MYKLHPITKNTHIFYTYYESAFTLGKKVEQVYGTAFTVRYDCSNLVELIIS
jgi:hypothetical protein